MTIKFVGAILLSAVASMAAAQSTSPAPGSDKMPTVKDIGKDMSDAVKGAGKGAADAGKAVAQGAKAQTQTAGAVAKDTGKAVAETSKGAVQTTKGAVSSDPTTKAVAKRKAKKHKRASKALRQSAVNKSEAAKPMAQPGK